MKNVSVSGASPSSALGPPAAPRRPGSSAEPRHLGARELAGGGEPARKCILAAPGTGGQLWGPVGFL